MTPKNSVGYGVLAVIGIVYAALRIYTRNSPDPAWAAFLREAFSIAMFVGVFVVLGPRSILQALQRHYSPRTRKHRARTGWLPLFLLICGISLLLYVVWTRYYQGLFDAVQSDV